MATHAPITGIPVRAPAFLPMHRREAIETEIELHLQRVTILVARLDRADAPFEDLEDGHDDEQTNEDGVEAPAFAIPRYGIDQSRRPTNERSATVAYQREMCRA